MTDSGATLPVSQTREPASTGELLSLMRDCASRRQPVYFTGGCTSLDYGLPAKERGEEISLAGLDQIVDHAAGDMTVTVEAGVKLQSLNEQLATAGQRLPFYVPQPDQATVGGIVATAWNGPQQFGLGGVRDYVIGISAIDGQGNPFKAGGRVVKNVAGYDFCKLLTGSLGTLAVITQLTFKLCPLPQQTAYAMVSVTDLQQADRLVQQLVESEVTPVAIELLCGPYWQSHPAIDGPSPPAGGALLAACLEGTAEEVNWMTGQLEQHWQDVGETAIIEAAEPVAAITHELASFSNIESELTVRAALRPSGVAPMMKTIRQIDNNVSIQAHAGTGIIKAQFSAFPDEGLGRTITGALQPKAASFDGHATVIRNPSGNEMTLQSVWAGGGPARKTMQKIKAQFDPHNLLNPGRFIFE